MASVPQGYRTAWREAAGDEPHAPWGPAGSLQRASGRAETHGAQLVGAGVSSPPLPSAHRAARLHSPSPAFSCPSSHEWWLFKATTLMKYLDIYFSNWEQWRHFKKSKLRWCYQSVYSRYQYKNDSRNNDRDICGFSKSVFFGVEGNTVGLLIRHFTILHGLTI